MSAVFLVSDTHFGHAGICRFTNFDGSKVRPWDDVEQMNEDMVKAWNETVRPGDRVYHLGDVVMNRRYLSILDRLNGRKALIKGNHDIFTDADYGKYFDKVLGSHVMNGMLLTHIPVHPQSLGRFGTNIHGHTHANRIKMMVGRLGYDEKYVNDIRYHCVCVEQTDFKPILFEDVLKRIEAEGGHVGFHSGGKTNEPD